MESGAVALGVTLVALAAGRWVPDKKSLCKARKCMRMRVAVEVANFVVLSAVLVITLLDPAGLAHGNAADHKVRVRKDCCTA